MNTLIGKLVFLAAVAIAFDAPAASAQIASQVDFKISQSLVAGNATLPAGSCVITVVSPDRLPRELSEIITHLAFYSGWSNAFAAINIVKDIFVQRGASTKTLPN